MTELNDRIQTTEFVWEFGENKYFFASIEGISLTI